MTHYEAIPAEHLAAMRKEIRQYPYTMLFLTMVVLFMGTWFGIVIANAVTFDQCGKSKTITYHSWIYEHDMKLACEVKHG